MKYVAFLHFARIEKKIVKTYGIAVIENKKCIRIIKDISMDRNAVKRFVKDLNDSQIELVHLDDVIEDFLCIM